ncbi:MAG: hypothetical protein Q4E68_03280 [Prevotellaceae bacterium]|nr:hypothetical protein [Prevotellaceae bacterium]
MNKKIDKDKKEKYIKVLCTEEQKSEILATANECNKSASRFLLERGLGYKPKHYLTEKELSLLESIQEFLINVSRFSNLVSGRAKGFKTKEQRLSFLMSIGVIKSWKEKLDLVIDYLHAFLCNVNFKHHYNYDR